MSIRALKDRALRKRRAAAGQCYLCTSPWTGKGACLSCKERHRRYMAARTAERRRKGLCLFCPKRDVKPAVKCNGRTMTRCHEHLEQHYEAERIRRGQMP